MVETRREHVARVLAQHQERRERLDAELSTLSTSVTGRSPTSRSSCARNKPELATNESSLNALRDTVQELQERQRVESEAAQAAGRRLADLEARASALSALQDAIGYGKDSAAWLAGKGLTHAHRLWQGLDIEPGWEDALESVLRERLNAIELDRLDAALAWIGDAAGAGDKGGNGLPGRIAAYARDGGGAANPAPGGVRCIARQGEHRRSQASRAFSPTGCAASAAVRRWPRRSARAVTCSRAKPS